MNSDTDEKGPAVKIAPPLIFLFSLFIAYGIHYYYPVHIGISSVLKYAGLVIVLLALGLINHIRRTFAKVETSAEPWKPTTSIISTGIYAYSRNPIYVALCFISIGIGLILNSFWVLWGFLPSAVGVYFTAIKKEEAYLEQKFGEEYLQYKKSVRCWL
jgi:protein-S-isoprenylcysteine O-methyltransferase Ste14